MLKIREYENRDWDEILGIFLRSKPDELKGSIMKKDIIPLDKDECLLKSFNESVIFVAEINGKIVGYAGYNKNLISFLFIDPDYYRKKVGTTLLEKVLSEIGEKAWLIVAKNNITAQELYRKFDFKVVEEFIGKYNGFEIEVFRLAVKPELETWKNK